MAKFKKLNNRSAERQSEQPPSPEEQLNQQEQKKKPDPPRKQLNVEIPDSLSPKIVPAPEQQPQQNGQIVSAPPSPSNAPSGSSPGL